MISQIPKGIYNLSMKGFSYYFCHECGSVVVASGNSSISCCSHTLSPLVLREAESGLSVMREGDEILVSSECPMTKEDFIAFVAFENWSGYTLKLFYPEWELHTSFAYAGKGRLVWYSTEKGAFFQKIDC